MDAHNALYNLFQARNYQHPDPGDAGTIYVKRQFTIVPLVSAASETRTLAVPTKDGIFVALNMATDGGDITLTVTSTFDGTNSTITFDDAGDWVVLYSVQTAVGTYRWRVLAGGGTNVGLSAPTATITNANITTSNTTTAGITNATLGREQIGTTAVTAAGSAIGNAANLSYGRNFVTATDNTTGVILPVAVANATVEVIQSINAKQLAVYPQVNSSIAGLAANVAFNTGVANTAAQAGTTQNVYFKFMATNATQWYASK
jgi:hypothetical protein